MRGFFAVENYVEVNFKEVLNIARADRATSFPEQDSLFYRNRPSLKPLELYLRLSVRRQTFYAVFRRTRLRSAEVFLSSSRCIDALRYPLVPRPQIES